MKLETILFLATWQRLANGQQMTLFPLPTKGKYGVDIRSLELVDETRIDPYDPNGGPRKLMLSALFPTMPVEECRFTPHQYVPDGTELYFDLGLRELGFSNKSASISTLALEICPSEQETSTSENDGNDSTPRYPVVLFSHALATSRLLSTAQAQSIAAQGYIVLAIDHPYSALVVQYDDGSQVTGLQLEALEDLDDDVRTRAKDVSFVVDQLQGESSLRRIPPLRGKKAVDLVAMCGNSLGGATASLAAYNNSRIIGVLDLDGAPFGFNTTGTENIPQFDEVPQGMDLPFLLFNTEENARGPFYTTLYSAYSVSEMMLAQTFRVYSNHWQGYKKRLALFGSAHFSFTDMPLIADLLGARPLESSEYIGTIDGRRARDAVAAYLTAFLDLVLKKTMSGLLWAPSADYPEVMFVGGGCGQTRQVDRIDAAFQTFASTVIALHSLQQYNILPMPHPQPMPQLPYRPVIPLLTSRTPSMLKKTGHPSKPVSTSRTAERLVVSIPVTIQVIRLPAKQRTSVLGIQKLLPLAAQGGRPIHFGYIDSRRAVAGFEM